MLSIVAGISISADVASAQSLGAAISDFDDGNRRYRSGDYRGAIESYQRAIQRDYASDALYFNMGNAYFRLGQIGEAIRFYEKARRLGSDRPELMHNLEIVREHTVDSYSRLPEPFWAAPWRSIVRALGAGGLFSIGFLFYLIGCTAVALRIRKGRTPWRRRAATVGLSVGVVLLLTGFAASAEAGKAQKAVVLAQEAHMLENPSGESADVIVHEGVVVEIVSESGRWTQVRLPNGIRGWVGTEDLGEI